MPFEHRTTSSMLESSPICLIEIGGTVGNGESWESMTTRFFASALHLGHKVVCPAVARLMRSQTSHSNDMVFPFLVELVQYEPAPNRPPISHDASTSRYPRQTKSPNAVTTVKRFSLQFWMKSFIAKSPIE